MPAPKPERRSRRRQPLRRPPRRAYRRYRQAIFLITPPPATATAPVNANLARSKLVNRVGLIASTVLVALALMNSMLFVVDQRQFGVLYALGQIKDVITEPGLNFKLPPPFQNVTYIDKRLLTLDSTDTEPMLTAEKQRVVIDWYVRWRISEPT